MRQSTMSFKSGIHPAPEYHEKQEIEVKVSRNPASQYLVLDSKDRFQSSTPNVISSQPWNNFRLQRPQSLMETFATRIGVAEIRFPWCIPNITSKNNKFTYVAHTLLGEQIEDLITIPSRFYTPLQLRDAINAEILASSVENNTLFPLTIDFDQSTFQYRVNPSITEGVDPITLGSFITLENTVTEYQYYNEPSLLLTMGMEYDVISSLTGFSVPYQGNVTETLYTQYVDIVSNKFNQYTTNVDGNSFANGSGRLICRLYLADEVSVGNNYDELYQCHLIHRQFKTPKMVMWNPQSVVDWLDISVVDQYNNLVVLPLRLDLVSSSENIITESSYPDFQITLLATEN